MKLTLTEIKALIRANLGSPQANQNASSALAGTEFETKGGVTGVILAELSPKGKVQARLTCIEAGCTETHVREQSDWHQSFRCRTHAASSKAKLTDEEKLARKVAAAKAFLAKAEADAS